MEVSKKISQDCPWSRKKEALELARREDMVFWKFGVNCNLYEESSEQS